MAQTSTARTSTLRLHVDNSLRLERAAFGAKVRAARAILGLSQDELAARLGLTQKSVHRIEQGAVEPKVRTIFTVQQFWRDNGIAFENLPDGGFKLAVRGPSLLRQAEPDAV
jgi:transcriptional regulator with XRE-family HTH domain